MTIILIIIGVVILAGVAKYSVYVSIKNWKLGAIFLSLYSLISINITAQSYKWGSVAMGGGGFVSGLLTSKSEQNLLYARTDVGGAYRWDATNASWISLLDWCSTSQTGYQGVLSFAIDPKATNKLYLLVGTSYFNNGATAILRSSDYGKTFSISDVSKQFKVSGNSMGRNNGERLQVDPYNGNILYCGSQANGLFKSTDAGISWAQVTSLGNVGTPNGNGINCLIVDSTDGIKDTASKTLYVFKSDTGTNFYRSDDAGNSFNAIPNAPTSLMPQRAVLAKDHNLYITYADKEGPYNATTGQIWKYNTLTGSWTNVTPSGIKLPFSGISVDPNNPLKLIASTINVYQRQYSSVYGDKFYLSTDGGTTWRDLIGSGIKMNANGCAWFGTASIHWAASIEFNPFNTDKAWVCSGNGVFYCNSISAATNTWNFGAKGIEETVPLDMVSIPGGPLMTVVGDYDGFKTIDPSVYGTRFSPAVGSNSAIAYASLNPQKLVRVGSSMFYSINQGINWTKCTNTKGTGGNVALSADGNLILYCKDNISNTYWSKDNGNSWYDCFGIGASTPVADPVNPNRFYSYNNKDGNMYTSIDGGANFTVSGRPGKGGSSLIRTAPDKNGHLWMAMNDGGLIYSVDSGATYTKISHVTNCAAVGLGKADSLANYYTLYIWGTVNGVSGVYRSINFGSSWVKINNNENGGIGNGHFINGDFNVFGRVYQSTVGRGVAYGEILAALPVKLISFSGTIDKNNQAFLHWITSFEINSKSFIIEKSSDAISFIEVGNVLSKATRGSNEGQSIYDFIDKEKVNGTVYYRLKQVDKDGKVSYSQVIKLVANKGVINLVNVYPNLIGTSNNVNVHIEVTDSQKVDVRVVDMSGKVYYSSLDTFLSAGKNDCIIKFKTTLPKGVYMVEVLSNEKKEAIGSSRFVVQ